MRLGLISTALLRESALHPWQLALTVLSIAAGVAVIVGVEIANQSALTEFSRANQIIDGVATHRIVGAATGIDEHIYRLVKVEAAIRDAAPVIAATVQIQGEIGDYQLLGIDPLSDYRIRQLRLSSGGASGAGQSWPLYVSKADLVARSKTVTVRSGRRQQQFAVTGVIESDAGLAIDKRNLLITDISWAQAFLNTAGRLSYIELKLIDPDEVGLLQSLLPDSVQLIDVALYNSAKQDMTRAFRINLTALGLLAMVIAMFLIYSTVSFQVVRRRPMIGLLRLSGVSSMELGRALLGELIIVGIAGTAAGIVLGYFLAHSLSAMVGGTIDALYFSLATPEVRIHPGLAVKAAAVGLGATLFASLVPILSASRLEVLALRQHVVGNDSRAGITKRALPAAILLGAFGAILLLLPDSPLFLAFAGLFILICALAIVTPWAINRLCVLAAGVQAVGRALVVKMVVLNIGAHQRRTAVAVAALSVAVSATLGVALMIDSFRFSVESWLEGYLRSDIYLTSQSVDGGYLSSEFLAELSTVPKVKSLAQGHRRNLWSTQGPITLFALQTNAHGFDGFQIKKRNSDDLWSQFESQGKVLVSEPYSHHHNVAVGDKVSLPTDKGNKDFEVAAIYFDYSSDRGLVTMSRRTYDNFYDDRLVSSAAIVLDEDTSVNRVMDQIQSLASAPDTLFLRSNRDLRQASLDVFDRTFRVTEVLRWLAVFVSVVGIASALMALQLDRGREYALMKAVGFSQWQLGGQILLETGVTGLVAGLMAVPLGMVLALSLIHVINVQSFGWSMQTVVDTGMIFYSVLLAIGAALLGGIYPAWRLWRSSISAGIRNE